MKTLVTAVCTILFCVTSAEAQARFGGRISNYGTDIDIGSVTVEPDRGTSLGLLGDYRNGAFVLEWKVEHDFESGIDIVDFLPFDIADYSRDKGEFAVGFAPGPWVDLVAGARIETFDVASGTFRNNFFDGTEFEHQALAFGVNVHTPTIRPVGFYANLRGYLGTADFDLDFASTSDDTIGYKAEIGIPIAVGLTGWEVAPAIEFERIETNDFDVEFRTNRVMINFIYSFQR